MDERHHLDCECVNCIPLYKAMQAAWPGRAEVLKSVEIQPGRVFQRSWVALVLVTSEYPDQGIPAGHYVIGWVTCTSVTDNHQRLSLRVMGSVSPEQHELAQQMYNEILPLVRQANLEFMLSTAFS